MPLDNGQDKGVIRRPVKHRQDKQVKSHLQVHKGHYEDDGEILMRIRVSNITDESSRKMEYLAFRWALDETGAYDTEELVPKLRRAVKEELTETQRKYVYDYYVRSWSMEAIGAEYGVNKSTISRTLARARRRLYRVLKYANIKFI